MKSIAALLWAAVIALAILAAQTPSDKVNIGEPLVIYREVPPAIVPVEHPLPRPIEHAKQLSDLRAAIWSVGEFASPFNLQEALEEMVGDPVEYQAPPQKRSEPRRSIPIAPDELRTLVEAYFAPEDVERALSVAWCESRYDTQAKNPRSSASGLYQHLSGWWTGEWGVTGAFDPFDPEQSVRAAAALVYNTASGWGNWNPSRHCWG